MRSIDHPGKENSWQRKIIKELPPTPVKGDNMACISLISSGVTKRSRHFDIDWFKFKDLVDNGEIEVTWVPTDDNWADFFTKKLAREKFEKFRDVLMGNAGLQNHFQATSVKITLAGQFSSPLKKNPKPSFTLLQPLCRQLILGEMEPVTVLLITSTDGVLSS